MPEPQIFRSIVWEAGPKRPTARVVDHTGQVVTTGDLTGTIALSVYDISSSTPTTAIFSTNRVIGNTVFDSLQPWEVDGQGYNFQDLVTTGEVVLEGGHTYRLSYRFNGANGTIPLLFDWRARGLISI